MRSVLAGCTAPFIFWPGGDRLLSGPNNAPVSGLVETGERAHDVIEVYPAILGGALSEVQPPRRPECRTASPGAWRRHADAELRRVLAGDCERLKAAKEHDPCGCAFPELPRLAGVIGG
jgi:hypothetical protein